MTTVIKKTNLNDYTSVELDIMFADTWTNRNSREFALFLIGHNYDNIKAVVTAYHNIVVKEAEEQRLRAEAYKACRPENCIYGYDKPFGCHHQVFNRTGMTKGSISSCGLLMGGVK